MTPRLVRRCVLAVCAVGVVGMIIGSAHGDNGVALTFGLVTAAAIACLIVATAVGTGSALQPGVETAARVDELTHQLVAGGAPAPTVEALVREAVKLGQGRRSRRLPAAEGRSA